jgi:hypothetical protein
MRKATNSDNDSPSRQLARYIKTATEQYVPQLEVELVYRNDRFTWWRSYSQNGFTAIRMCEMNENYDHQHQDLRTEKGLIYDLPEFMDFDYLRKTTAANLASLTNLALAPRAPKRRNRSERLD